MKAGFTDKKAVTDSLQLIRELRNKRAHDSIITVAEAYDACKCVQKFFVRVGCEGDSFGPLTDEAQLLLVMDAAERKPEMRKKLKLFLAKFENAEEAKRECQQAIQKPTFSIHSTHSTESDCEIINSYSSTDLYAFNHQILTQSSSRSKFDPEAEGEFKIIPKKKQ